MIRTGEETVLTLEGVSKTFLGQRALDDVSFDVRAGEIHALLGTNGSGKSTLIKILAGYYTADPGASAAFRGESFSLGGPLPAGGRIRFIHQDLGLVDELSAADNMALVQGFSSRWWISGRRERANTRRILERLGVQVDEGSDVGKLTRAEQTMLAIARAVGEGLGEGSVLVLDEPTAALPGPQVRLLFGLLDRLKSEGVAIIFVTHRLGEVLEIADRLTILRDGRKIVTRDVAGLDHDALVELILGRALPPHVPAPIVVNSGARTAFEIRDVRSTTVHGATISASEGEIVGITGVVGSGYDQILSSAYGANPEATASVTVGETHVERPNPSRCIAAGVAYVPADRKRLSTILDWTVRENLTLPKLSPRTFLRWLSPGQESREVAPELEASDVRPRDPERLIRLLSGGNQQKVVLARWLRCGPQALMLDEPTNGIDSGAKRAVYDAIRGISARGVAILMTSQDPEELTAVCDRVVVLRDGRVGAELRGDQITPDIILAESLRVAAPLEKEAHA